MNLDCDALRTLVDRRAAAWSDRDAILYALATASGEPPDKALVDERGLTVLPTFLSAVARNAMPTVGDLGGDYAQTVLAGIEVKIELPLPAAAQAIVENRIEAVTDLGPSQGALIVIASEVSTADGLLGRVKTNVMARGDGGCGGFGTRSPRTETPDRSPDASLMIPTRRDQALLYRLLGDRNPLHFDQDAAAKAGYPGPILHGLCTFGIAAQALHRRGKNVYPLYIATRFTAPFFPGESLRLDLWDTDGGLAFRGVAEERGAVVLAGGKLSSGAS